MKSPTDSRHRRIATIIGVVVALSIFYVSRADAAVFDDAPRIDLGTGARPLDVATGDFNNDGKRDLAVTDWAAPIVGATDKVAVYFGDGKGGFKYDEGYGGLVNPQHVSVADFNNDGQEDLLVGLDTGGKNVAILQGLPSGRFSHLKTIEGSVTLAGLEVGDFNADGRADFAAAGFGQVTVGLGDGAFGFTTTPTLGVGFPTGLAVDDYDQDGRDDVAFGNLANGGEPRIFTARSLGDGKLGTLVPTPVPAQGGALENADFNEDGIPDLAVATPTLNRVQIRLGTGAGKFDATLPPVVVGTKPEGLAIADVDADGHDDLLSAGSGQNSVSVRFGRGDGTFGTEDEITAGEDPVSLAAGDFDNNGVIDWAAANRMGQGVTVRLGNSKPVLDGNLIANGGFEEGLKGWTSGGAPAVARYGATPHWGIPTHEDAARLGPGGLSLLAGGANPLPGGISTVTQTLDVAARGPFIDTGKGEATLSADLGGGVNVNDTYTVTATFMDKKGTALGEVSVGPVTPSDRHNVTTLLRRTAKKALPIGTRAVRVTATSKDADSIGSSALVDNLKLTLELPTTPVDPTPQPGNGGGGTGGNAGGAGGNGGGTGGGTGGTGGGGLDPTGPNGQTGSVFGTDTKVTVKLAAKKVSRRGPVTAVITNRNAFAVRGTVSATTGSGRRKVTLKGAVSPTVAGGRSARVKIKLSSRARGLLKAKRKVTLNVAAVVVDPAGNRRTVRMKVAARLK